MNQHLINGNFPTENKITAYSFQASINFISSLELGLLSQVAKISWNLRDAIYFGQACAPQSSPLSYLTALWSVFSGIYHCTHIGVGLFTVHSCFFKSLY
jgi:hypothetical protein